MICDNWAMERGCGALKAENSSRQEKKEDREIRWEDFAPWSYSLHYITAEEPWTYRHHRHFGCFELVYTLSGTVEHLLEGTWRSFPAGDLLAVGEEDFHSIRGRNFSYANLVLPTAFWSDYLRALEIDDPLGSPIRCRGKTVAIVSERRAEIRDILDRLFRHQQTEEGERQLRRFLGILLFEIYWEDSREESVEAKRTGAEGGIPSWWNDFVRRVGEDGAIPEDPAEMAEWAGRSREHVARTCRRITGLTPSAWLNGQRLERAALILRKTNRDIADIAYGLGFGSLPHFYRLFKERFGEAPKKYRTAHGDPPAEA
jgi:AraC family transcriptional regulator, dual regulator of chb operon